MIRALILVALICSINLYAGSDKALHFGISGVIGGGVEHYIYKNGDLKPAQRVLLATGIGTIPGLAKEIIDSRSAGNHFSKGDLAFDIAGAFTGVLLSSLLFERVHFYMDDDEASISWSTPF